MHTTDHDRGQCGASLVLVLAVMAFLAAMVPAVLGLAFTGLRVTQPVLEDRAELYAASSAIDAATALGRHDADIGVPGGPCPSQALSIDGLDVIVGCSRYPLPEDGCHYVDRFVTYTAEVRRPGESEVLARSSAEVVFRFDPDGPPRVEVRQFTPDASGPVTTTPLPACATTTTSSTTTTTTTPSPVVGSYAVWSPPSSESQPANKWRAVGPLEVADHTGAAIEGADVTVGVEYQVKNDPVWHPDDAILGTTNATGSVTFHSKSYPKNGSARVEAVRFTVLGVAYEDLAFISAANPTAIEVARP